MGMTRYSSTIATKSWLVMSRAPRKALSNPWDVVSHLWRFIRSRSGCIPRLDANNSISTRATFPIRYSLGSLTKSLRLWAMRMVHSQSIRRQAPWLRSPRSRKNGEYSCRRPRVAMRMHLLVLPETAPSITQKRAPSAWSSHSPPQAQATPSRAIKGTGTAVKSTRRALISEKTAATQDIPNSRRNHYLFDTNLETLILSFKHV